MSCDLGLQAIHLSRFALEAGTPSTLGRDPVVLRLNEHQLGLEIVQRWICLKRREILQGLPLPYVLFQQINLLPNFGCLNLEVGVLPIQYVELIFLHLLDSLVLEQLSPNHVQNLPLAKNGVRHTHRKFRTLRLHTD